MNTYIALLRGINIGSRNKILMADLRELFADMGFTNIKTYIQTGNVLFSTNESFTCDELSDIIKKRIFDKYGFEIPTLVNTAKEIEEIVSNNPFIKEGITDINRLHVTFLKNFPSEESLSKIEEYANISNDDRFIIIGKTVYLYCPTQYRDTKFGNNFFEKKLGVTSSTRNWKTTLKLHQMFE